MPRTNATGYLPVFILCLLSGLQGAVAQTTFYNPVAQNKTTLQSFAGQFEKKYNADVAQLSAPYKTELKELYKMRWEYAKELFDHNEIFIDPKAQAYLDAMVEEVRKGNPRLQSVDFKCFFSRTHIPNASYLCHGLMVFNMGMFTRLDNESQAAFILCHEISHFILDHAGSAINKYVTTYNSKEFQSELKRINKQEYGKREELEKLMKGVVFNNRRHSRDHEAQADSMAIELMKNTRFQLKESISALAIMDSIDKERFNTTGFLQQAFNSSEYPFQKKWVQKEEGLLGGHAVLKDENAEIADSLKTHPDCKVRIGLLQPMVEKLGKPSNAVSPLDATAFRDLQNEFRYEIIEYAVESDNYTGALYNTLKQLEQHPNDPYLVTTVGRIMNEFYTAQKEHRLGKICEQPNPWYAEHYNMLLQFIQNLRREDYGALSHYFLERYKGNMISFPAFKSVYDKNQIIFQQL